MFRVQVHNEHVPVGYWNNIVNQKAKMEELAKKLSIICWNSCCFP